MTEHPVGDFLMTFSRFELQNFSQNQLANHDSVGIFQLVFDTAQFSDVLSTLD